MSITFSQHPSGHYFLPIIFYGKKPYPYDSILIPQCFVDTGATKCVVPRTFNRLTLQLPIKGRDRDVGTANGKNRFNYVIVPKMTIARISMGDHGLVYTDTKLQLRNVPTWLGADDEDFIVGMSFIHNFDVTMKKRGNITLRT